MANCLAPGYLKIFYTSNAHDHVMTIPVSPVAATPGFGLNTKGGGPISQAEGLEGLTAVLVPFYEDSDIFHGFEAYTQADCDSLPVLQNTGTFTGVVGTGMAADVPYAQAVLTFKGSAGTRGKVQLMEGGTTVNVKSTLNPGGAGIENDLAEYLLSAESIYYTRGNQWLAVALNYVTKTNDVLRKKYLLP